MSEYPSVGQLSVKWDVLLVYSVGLALIVLIVLNELGQFTPGQEHADAQIGFLDRPSDKGLLKICTERRIGNWSRGIP